MKLATAAAITLATTMAFAAAPALAGDPAHGQALFRAQCGLCHVGGAGDGEGGQGPTLAGVIGRKIGGDPNFAYSDALAQSKATWTQDTLANFLANPQAAIPGTVMPVSVKDATDRADIAAYLATLKP